MGERIVMKHIVLVILIFCMTWAGIGSVHIKKEMTEKKTEAEVTEVLASYEKVVSRQDELEQIMKETEAFETEEDNPVFGALRGVYECYDADGTFVSLCVETSQKNRLTGVFVHLLIQFNPEGKISSITVLSDSLLPGEGKCIADQSFWEQFYGIYCRYFSYQITRVSKSDHIVVAKDSPTMVNTALAAINLAISVRSCQYPDFCSEVIIEIGN